LKTVIRKGDIFMASKIELDLAAVNGGQDFAVLTGKGVIYPYEGGKRTSDVPVGTKVTVALQGNMLTPLSVKIPGNADPLPKASDEQIAASMASLKLVGVRFTDCRISLYSIENQIVMSATASGVELVSIGGGK
jgi:hypothetical protein